MQDNFQNITNQDLKSGLRWYRLANRIAKSIANKYKLKIETVVGIVSALSPGINWKQNIIDTIELIEKENEAKVTTYNQNKLKALDILFSDSIDLDIYKYFFLKKKCGWKTANFYLNILNPNDKTAVTIDRHILDIFSLTRKDINTNKKYLALKAKLIAKAKTHNLIPCQYQAIIWKCHKRLKHDTLNYEVDVPF